MKSPDRGGPGRRSVYPNVRWESAAHMMARRLIWQYLRSLAPASDRVMTPGRNELARFIGSPAYLELAKSIEEKQAALKCPPTYKELDSRKDRARLNELKAESEGRPLTAAESFEQRHLQARLEVYSPTPESAYQRRAEEVEARRPEVLLVRTPAVCLHGCNGPEPARTPSLIPPPPFREPRAAKLGDRPH
jgi:hypothetical protein